MHRVLLTGTGTGVGKTWAGARLAAALPGPVRAWKPAQSFAPGEGPTDAEVLAAATGQAPEAVCPRHRWYPVALAPPEAADELGLPPFTITDLVAEMPAVAGDEGGSVLLVEGAGGVRSPLAADGDTVALAGAVGVDHVVLVAHAGLGTINDVRLATGALAGATGAAAGAVPVTVLLNRWDPGSRVCARNAAFLRGEGFEVATDVGAAARLVGERVVHADRG